MPNTQRIDHILSNLRDTEKLNKKVIRISTGIKSSSAQIQNLIKRIKPDEIYNLYPKSFKVSFEIPEYTYDIVG